MDIDFNPFTGKFQWVAGSSGSSNWVDEGDLLKPKDGENIGLEAGKRIYFDL